MTKPTRPSTIKYKGIKYVLAADIADPSDPGSGFRGHLLISKENSDGSVYSLFAETDEDEPDFYATSDKGAKTMSIDVDKASAWTFIQNLFGDDGVVVDKRKIEKIWKKLPSAQKALPSKKNELSTPHIIDIVSGHYIKVAENTADMRKIQLIKNFARKVMLKN